MHESQALSEFADVFSALEVPDADGLRARVQMAAILTREIRASGWTQVEAAGILGVDQSDVSRIMRGNVHGFSQERLIRLLNILGFNVVLRVERLEEESVGCEEDRSSRPGQRVEFAGTRP